MWIQRSGYHPPNETIAIHSRRRYRLLPPKVPNPNLAPPDPALWIVHYSRAPQTDHIPAVRIPVTPQMQAVLAQRRFLQSQGQLVRKDFMLHDRNNWPTISFPPQMGPQGFSQPASVYPGPMPGRPQGPFYPPHQTPGVLPGSVGPTPAKAPRGHRGSTGAMAAAAVDFSLEDEETSTGDILDLLAPREISKMRYQQHHEWMEEVFASPYTIKQVTPVDLGLGRKGELESLTAGFFEAPVSHTPGKDQKDTNVAMQTGKMEPDKAEEFADRVAKRVADMTAEIEKLKKRHARRMEKLIRLEILRDAEQRLRDAATDPSETGTEIWRLEGRIDLPDEEETPADNTVRAPKYKVDDVVKELEASYGRSIVPEPNISCVEKGGLLERIEPEPAPPESNGVGQAEGDIVMDNTDSHLLDEFGTPATSTPGQGQEASATAATDGSAAGQTSTKTGLPQLDGDVEMGGASNQPNQTHTAEGETGDWVVVDNEAAVKDAGSAADKLNVATPGSGAPSMTPGQATAGLETSNFDDATNFTNMDSAGDALAAYGEQHDLDLPDLDNSAFGDAFHASDNEIGHHPGDEDDMS
jgi:hypothetical protein